MLSLRCPCCHVTLSAVDGGFSCAEHGSFSQTQDGIVFLFEKEENFFQAHWNDNQLPDVPKMKLAAAETFLAPLLETKPRDYMCWLDVGTGDGVHLTVLRERFPNVELVGLDISLSGLQSAAKRAPGSLLMLADGQNIPLQDACLDATFSYGVLAYMRDPWLGLSEMVRVTRPGGLIGVWFYPKVDTLLGCLFGLTRAVVPRLPHFLQVRFADFLVPILGMLPTAGGLSLRNASWKACRESILVNIAPARLVFPTEQEIVSHLERLGCRIVFNDKKNHNTLWAIRSSSVGAHR